MTALKSLVVLLVVMTVASFLLQSTVAQTRHVVGDAMGWSIPPGGAATYATWAAQRTFAVGDTLLFNFTTGLHNVAEVPQAAYGACSSINTLSLNPTGPAPVTLTRPGAHYYICTVTSHCQIGQKLSINVSPLTAATPESAPLSPAPTFELSPTGSPVPPPLSASPIGSLVSPPLSASPALAAVVPVTFLAVALALFY